MRWRTCGGWSVCGRRTKVAGAAAGRAANPGGGWSYGGGVVLDVEPERVFGPRYRATTVGIVTVVTLVAFEALAVATALPTAVRELDGLALYGWAFTAFLVTSVVGMVAGGEMSDRWGPARPLLLGFGLFAVGLTVAGVAPGMEVFIAARAVQGVGAGVQIVAVYVLIAMVYPEGLRPKVFAATAAAWVVPALVGPVVAGAVAQHLSWRLIFLGLLPAALGGVGLLLPTLRRLPAASLGADAAAPEAAGVAGAGSAAAGGSAVTRRESGRWVAACAAAGGIAAVQAAGQRVDWVAVPLGLVGLGLLVVGLRRLLPRGSVLFRRGVPAVVGLRGTMAGAMFGAESLVPLSLTLVHGYSPTAAGLPLVVSALCWSTASWWQGRHPDLPRYALIRAGFVLIGVAVLGMALVAQPGTPGWLAYPFWGLAGAGAGMTWPSIAVVLLALTPPDRQGTNSAAIQIADAVGSALSIGLGGVLVAAATRGVLGLPRAVLILDVLLAAVAAASAVLAGRARAPE
jgi:MFS family permease